MVLHFVLNCSRNLAQAATVSRLLAAEIKGIFGHLEQPPNILMDDPDWNRRGGVTDKAIQNDSNVQLHCVSGLDSARAADPTHDLVVLRDTNFSRKFLLAKEHTATARPYPSFSRRRVRC